MKIYLTGSTGFIGSHLIQKLSDHEVICLVSPTAIGTRPLPKEAKIEYLDLTDFDAVRSSILKHKPEVIIHLGAVTPVRYSFENPAVYQDVNFLATINLVNTAMKVDNFKKFIFASTMETYGWQRERKPFTEDLALNPGSPYAVSKVAAETFIRSLGISHKFPYLVSRACNTFGRKDEKGFIIEYLVTSMLKNQTPEVGTPDAVRDLMYVDDHVNGYLKLLEYELPGADERKQLLMEDPTHFVFNFGNGSELTIREVAHKLKIMIGYKGEIKEGFPSDYPNRPVAESYLSLNNQKAKRLLGWAPKTSLDEGLRTTIEHWKNLV